MGADEWADAELVDTDVLGGVDREHCPEQRLDLGVCSVGYGERPSLYVLHDLVTVLPSERQLEEWQFVERDAEGSHVLQPPDPLERVVGLGQDLRCLVCGRRARELVADPTVREDGAAVEEDVPRPDVLVDVPGLVWQQSALAICLTMLNSDCRGIS
jgi:hypothetical protein